jgi:MoxR-like ATPase
MYASPDETLAALERVGYFTDKKTATTVYLAGKLHRPIMLEGPAGAGKTELATSVSHAYGIPLLRLQCYQGINEEKTIGQYDKSLQELYVLLMSKSDHTPDWAEIKREVTSRAYFMAGPLLEAIEQKQRCVLLIDEIDKVDYAFEAMLLELLSAWTLSIPKMGRHAPNTARRSRQGTPLVPRGRRTRSNEPNPWFFTTLPATISKDREPRIHVEAE